MKKQLIINFLKKEFLKIHIFYIVIIIFFIFVAKLKIC